MDPDFNDIADRFAKAFEEGDIAVIDSLYAPDAIVWHNTDEREQSRAENIAFAKAVPDLFESFSYHDVRRSVFADGYVQQHVVHVVQNDGVMVKIPVCAIVRIANGQITRIDEYYDSKLEPDVVSKVLKQA